MDLQTKLKSYPCISQTCGSVGEAESRGRSTTGWLMPQFQKRATMAEEWE